jgi:hypothetical protein
MLKNDYIFKIVVLSILSMAILFIIIGENHRSSNLSDSLSDYQTIYDTDSIPVQEIISKISTDFPNVFLDLEQIGKIELEWADNMVLKPKHLSLFIKEGDSIRKPANSDSIFVYKSDKMFHFILGERIWK